MNPEPTPETTSREATLPSACMLCGGDLQIKVTGHEAYSYCRACHWLDRPEVTVTFNGLQISFKHSGSA